MARTVIQISADPSYLYALCDDGEIFRLVNHAWQPRPQSLKTIRGPLGPRRNPDLILLRMNSRAAKPDPRKGSPAYARPRRSAQWLC
jgi:hypothetical protein